VFETFCQLKERFCRSVRFVCWRRSKENACCPWLVVYTKEREKRCEHPLNCEETRKTEAVRGDVESCRKKEVTRKGNRRTKGKRRERRKGLSTVTSADEGEPRDLRDQSKRKATEQRPGTVEVRVQGITVGELQAQGPRDRGVKRRKPIKGAK